MNAFNINDWVWFRLTPRGWDVYRKWREGVLAIVLPSLPEHARSEHAGAWKLRVDKDGYSKMQLWHFMEVFGPAMSLGSKACIEECQLYFSDPSAIESPEPAVTT